MQTSEGGDREWVFLKNPIGDSDAGARLQSADWMKLFSWLSDV